ncbi:predicted GPI-anchored protein 58 [Miscanthus floridulus]|uniref:predicted GPI-anchored protein 58 n=1 Tax=Miscanthus floridulus TaxID=154761 RepID=UPI00345794FA
MCGPAHTLTHSTQLTHARTPPRPPPFAAASSPRGRRRPPPPRSPLARPAPPRPRPPCAAPSPTLLVNPAPARRRPGHAPPRRRPSPPRPAAGHRIWGAPAAPDASAPCPPSPCPGHAPLRRSPAPPRSASGHRFRAAPAARHPAAALPAVPRLPDAGPRQRPRRVRARPWRKEEEEQDLSEGTRSTSVTLIVFVGVAVLPAQRRLATTPLACLHRHPREHFPGLVWTSEDEDPEVPSFDDYALVATDAPHRNLADRVISELWVIPSWCTTHPDCWAAIVDKWLDADWQKEHQEKSD